MMILSPDDYREEDRESPVIMRLVDRRVVSASHATGNQQSLRVKRNPIKLRILLVTSRGVCIITQHCNDLSVFPVVFLIVWIRLTRNIDPSAVSIREVLNYQNKYLRVSLRGYVPVERFSLVYDRFYKRLVVTVRESILPK